MPASHLTIVHYPPGQAWSCQEVSSPDWPAVASAIGKMDDNEYPIVQLSWKEVESCFSDPASLNVIGGAIPGFAMFEFFPGWMFENPSGGDDDVHLWKSDQGYFCKRRNIINDFVLVLELARRYFETGSYEAVEAHVSALHIS